MDTLEALLAAIHEAPGEPLHWEVLADYLQEENDPRGELLRLHLDLRAASWGAGDLDKQARLVKLLDAGVRPCMPGRTNSLGMEFVLIPPGRFRMGSPDGEPGRYADESPRHEVEITRPFYLGVHTVTQGQYGRIVGANPSTFRAGGLNEERVEGVNTTTFPVENISSDDALLFCVGLAARPEEASQGRHYRLPTEAEWEYACRAGASAQAFHFADELLPVRANFDWHLGPGRPRHPAPLRRPCPVGSYPPNAWGLYDMHGNVWEWVSDWMAADWYARSPRQDPRGPAWAAARGFRGGAWCSAAHLCRASCRSADRPGLCADYLGFRVVLEWRATDEVVPLLTP